MAQKLLGIDEAAKMLGITADELNHMRERREVFAFRDGASWKFKPQEIERILAERSGGSDDEEESGELSAQPISLEEEAGGENDSILLSEMVLGDSGSSIAGTVIGKPGEARSASDSDIELAEVHYRKSDSQLKADSDVTLVPDVAASDSGVKLVPMPSGADQSGTVELELSNLALDDGDSTDLPFDIAVTPDSGLTLGDSGVKQKPGSSKVRVGEEKKPGSSKTRGGSKPGSSKVKVGEEPTGIKPGSDLTLGSDVLGAAIDDVLSLGDSRVPLGEARSKDQPGSGHGSAIELGSGEFDDDDLVLGSHVGSDIHDSGISLASPADSGLSLEQPLELNELGAEMIVDDDSSSDGSTGNLTADDDFLLTPAVEIGDDEGDESGSQVIALDTEGEFDDSAATLLGEQLPGGGTGGILEEDLLGEAATEDPLVGAAAAGMTVGAPLVGVAPAAVSREAPYSALNILSLGLCFLFLTLTGMMMFDLLRNMWSWEGSYQVNSALMDAVLGLFEG